jgi:hypothetical protein
VRLGCWLSPCYGPFSVGASFETYKPFISLIFLFFRAAVNRGYGLSGYGGTIVVDAILITSVFYNLFLTALHLVHLLANVLNAQ